MPTANGQLEFIDEPWAGLQRGEYSYLGSRDTNYFQTYPYFKLRSDVDEYVIVYGVNHHTTGKATYESFSVYVEPTFWDRTRDRPGDSGVIRTLDEAGPPGDSARKYLQPGDPYYEYADRLFAWKVGAPLRPRRSALLPGSGESERTSTAYPTTITATRRSTWTSNPTTPDRRGQPTCSSYSAVTWSPLPRSHPIATSWYGTRRSISARTFHSS